MNLTEKYRPTNLDQVIGHQEVIKSLKRFVETKSIPHAILFSGSNGVGKTTLARIIASELDAEILELDGATFGKIEVMREIQENIVLPSLFNKNRVCIIDECQGLSKQAFDSWLKIIEEPPPHVYFIFCTTEPEKVVKGVVQRCHHYKLNPVSYKEIKAFLLFIAENENMTIDRDIIDLIAMESKGSPRQALIYLSQLRDVTNIEEASIILNTAFDRPEVIDLCRNIVKKEGFMSAVRILEQLKDVSPYSIKIQILNYLNACIFKAKNEKDAVYFLTLLSIFDKISDSMSSLLLAVGEVYFEVKEV